jgi:hypothetical protein
VDAWWEKLRDRAEVVEPLFDTPYGTRKFTVKDPDGTSLVSSARTDDGTRFGSRQTVPHLAHLLRESG